VSGEPCYELRRYTLHPGGREVLTHLFARHFAAGQRAVGIDVYGPYDDLADADQFVWLRSFPDMDRRRDALGEFYYGPVWREHRDRANATMIDSDNVLLLRPETEIRALDAARLHVSIWPSSSRPLVSLVADAVPVLEEAGCSVAGVLSTLHAVNTFPALPVREDDALVLICAFDSDDPADRFVDRLAASLSWEPIAAKIDAIAGAPPEVLRLRAAPQ
jgi:hypothetical protein